MSKTKTPLTFTAFVVEYDSAIKEGKTVKKLHETIEEALEQYTFLKSSTMYRNIKLHEVAATQTTVSVKSSI